MSTTEHDVASATARSSAAHTDSRAPQFALTPPHSTGAMAVTKRNGKREPVDLNKIVRAVTRAADGLLRFVDRRKNIIRRSGENIAAAEVEAVLQAHPWVEQAAVLAVPDDLREEEVLACVVLREAGRADPMAAIDALFAHCQRELAYYKAPGWVWITDHIPTTSTQKIQKHQIFEPGSDPRTLPGIEAMMPSRTFSGTAWTISVSI